MLLVRSVKPPISTAPFISLRVLFAASFALAIAAVGSAAVDILATAVVRPDCAEDSNDEDELSAADVIPAAADVAAA